MRRLPIYIVLDISDAMRGEPIEATNNGLLLLETTLKQDPYALETAYISVITFGSSANQIIPLTEVGYFKAPNIQAGGLTSLGGALTLLADCIESEVKKNTSTEKGDWKPMVFLMCGTEPTDDWQKGLNNLQKVKFGTVVICAAGIDININVLQHISENVVQLDAANADSIRAFFKWITQTVAVSSLHVDENNEIGDMEPSF